MLEMGEKVERILKRFDASIMYSKLKAKVIWEMGCLTYESVLACCWNQMN